MIEREKSSASSLLDDMRTVADQMRALILATLPQDLLGFIYSRLLRNGMMEQGVAQESTNGGHQHDVLGDCQFLLEYVHAVFASAAPPSEVTFDESQCTELLELAAKLREQAMLHAIISSTTTLDGVFGPDTAEIEFHAKSVWVAVRGHRYPVLEGEFYLYVLTPHNDALVEVYGVDAALVAQSFQEMADSIRTGHANAATKLSQQMETVEAYAIAHDKPLEDAMEVWVAANPEQSRATVQALDDLLRGGVANVSRHTTLPPALLTDLAYQRGEETEFFAAGELSGTPFRTLPARKRPLIQLGSDYYAVDPCFTRDSGYRCLLYNLLQRKPGYKKTFEARQKIMSEGAFADILAAQLSGARCFREIYYKDPVSKQWVESDTLVLLDDALFLVEAKAGAAATIASPAVDFDRHATSIRDLVIKAYGQCERFFNYLNSSDEVPLFHMVCGKYEECVRVRRSDYRVMVPVGLTVESFAPFSAYCKELTQIQPLLGKYPFVSLSIDDLFVLKRLLPTPGEFVHYMEVRQAVAGMRRAYLFDEIDHLGAYIQRNRFDHAIADEMKANVASVVVWSGMGEIVDKSFEGNDWESRPFPTQHFPDEVRNLLGALDATRAHGWLSAESSIRNFGEQGRNDLAKMMSECCRSLNHYSHRYFALAGDGEPLFLWLQKYGDTIDWVTINERARAAALSLKASSLLGVVVEAKVDGACHRAQSFTVEIPSP